jgi:hypothetical protein
MSNIVFPAFAPPHWNWKYPVKKTPSYNTTTQTPTSGRGQLRIANQVLPIWKFSYDISYIKGDAQAGSDSAWQTLVGFIMGQQGAAGDWLFSDPYDNNFPNTAAQTFAYGDGVTTAFQLYRQIGNGNDIVQNINGAPSIYVGGVLQTPFAGTGSPPFYYIGRENLLLQSQAFNLSPWVTGGSGASGPTITPNSVAAPDGTMTADTIAFPSTVGGNQSYIIQDPMPPSIASETFTLSVWLKCASGTQSVDLYVNCYGQSFVSPVTVTTSWTRFSAVQTIDSLPAANFLQVGFDTRNEAAQTVYAWGAQFERSATATGYLPTTTSIAQPNGVVTFVSAPAAGVRLTWNGGFYYRCHFLEDEWTGLEEQLYQIWELAELKFESVIL